MHDEDEDEDEGEGEGVMLATVLASGVCGGVRRQLGARLVLVMVD